MKKKYLLTCIIFFLAFGWWNHSLANHLAGGEITWTCIGQDSFLIKLVVYRDCNGQVLGSGTLGINCASNMALITAVNTVSVTPIDITPVCNNSCTRCQSLSCSFPYGIHKYTIQNVVKLNGAGNCCKVKIAWVQCCRNSAITTISISSGVDLYLESTMDRCQSPCDNSPTFNYNPVAILCVGQDSYLNFSATDNDKTAGGGLIDSLTYEFGAPMKAYNSYISYLGQYSYNKPIYFWGFPNDALPFPRGIHLDMYSGILQFRPMKAEGTVMVIVVNEFRNGVKIAEIRRDVEAIVITCLSNNPPGISSPGNIRTKSICVGDSVQFSFQTTDPNPADTVTLSWSNNIPGSVWKDSNGLTKRSSASFYWKPTASQASSQPYYFTVIASDNFFPISLQSSQQYTVNVKANVSGNYTVTKLSCGWYLFNATATQGSGFPFIWHGSGGINYSAKTFYHHFKQSGKYYFSFSTSSNYFCGNTINDSIITDTFMSVAISGNKSPLCYGNSLNLMATPTFSKGKVSYRWNTGDTTSSITVHPLKSTWYKVSVTDSLSCPAVDSVNVVINNPIKLNADSIRSCRDVTVYLDADYGFNSYKWNTGATSRYIGIYSNQPSWYKVTAVDNAGCTTSDSAWVDRYPDAHVYAGKDTSLCAFKGSYELIGYPDHKSGYSGYWSGDALYQDTTGRWFFNINSDTVYNSFKYCLNYIYTDTFGCISYDDVCLWVHKYNDIYAGKDTSLCVNAGKIKLKGSDYSMGYWQGNGVKGNEFNPALAGAGTHMITYNVNDYCLFSDTSYITVYDLPNIQINTSTGKTEFCPQGLISLSGSPAGGTYGGKWTGDVVGGHFFNTNQNEGTYKAKYTYTDNNGCSNSDSLSLKISFPKVSIDTTQKTVCFGNSILLKAHFNFANSFLWTVDSISDGSFTGNTHNDEVMFKPGPGDFNNGGFLIRVRTFSNICEPDTDTYYFRTGYNPKTYFRADKLSGAIPLLVNFTDSSSVQKGNISSYEWYFGDGNYSIQKDPVNYYNLAGSFDVRHYTTSDLGCRDSLIKHNYIHTINSLSEDNNSEKLVVYPNPAFDFTELSLSGKQHRISQFYLYNASGLLIQHEQNINSGSVIIKTLGLNPGLYLLRVVSDRGKEYLERFVKE
jgi:hypothetical protein